MSGSEFGAWEVDGVHLRPASSGDEGERREWEIGLTFGLDAAAEARSLVRKVWRGLWISCETDNKPFICNNKLCKLFPLNLTPFTICLYRFSLKFFWTDFISMNKNMYTHSISMK